MISYVAQLLGFFSPMHKTCDCNLGEHQRQLLNVDYEKLTIVCLSSQKISGNVCGCHLNMILIRFLRNWNVAKLNYF